MKTLFATFILCASFPVNAYESIGDHSIRETYKSQKGYAHEKKCFRYEYREQYIPGNQGAEVGMKHFQDGGYHQISSRLTNNAFELKGVGINRWEPLFFDPQKNLDKQDF